MLQATAAISKEKKSEIVANLKGKLSGSTLVYGMSCDGISVSCSLKLTTCWQPQAHIPYTQMLLCLRTFVHLTAVFILPQREQQAPAGTPVA
jgi:hypothetical protein